jgi:orotidine-5'-phosphate decarboxylase
MQATFGERLTATFERVGPLCVGLEPSRDVLRAWNLPDTSAGLAAFLDAILPALAAQRGIVKPQAAFFERFGGQGFVQLERALGVLRASGVLVILDAKRGDIGSSMEGYADAYFGSGPMRVDALTINPYLGVEALQPVVTQALAVGGGVFVLARTSNAEAATLQSAIAHDGRKVYEHVFAAVEHWNTCARGLGSIGVVVGATLADAQLGLERSQAPVLAPGIGFQGATPEVLPRHFAGVLNRVIPSCSRGLLSVGPERFAEELRQLSDRCSTLIRL